jgi:hypothetical protein
MSHSYIPFGTHLRSKLLLSFFFLGFPFLGNSQVHYVKVGVFINSLYDFNIADNSFKTDFWGWCVYQDSSLKMDENIEFPYTKEHEIGNTLIEIEGGKQWFTFRAVGEVMKSWNTKNYPFDKQTLSIQLGCSQEYDEIRFIPDLKNSKIDPELKLKDWKVNLFKVDGIKRVYATTFGSPTLDSTSDYPEFRVRIEIERTKSWFTFIKLVIGLVIAFVISSCVFFIRPTNLDPRFGLCVGGLFTAVGNKYITDSIVPVSSEITLLDKMHVLTFVCIFLMVVLSVISLNLAESENKDLRWASTRVDRLGFYIILSVYFLGFLLISLWR